jgi:hydroxymethylpyrimidine pyrophosphatase-like HAD family hydrolase
VKLSVIALDYDGTTARHDSMGPVVRDAIAAARACGITVLLVTGRILDELRRVAGDLRFVDGVVAENGAVLHFPDSGHTTLLAPVVPGAYVDELRRRGVPHQAGQCLVDADANEASVLLHVIRALELPLVLIFNGGRVMTLPQGVSKATGLEQMLRTIRRSARNTLAIGDAENDHELLRLAEVGAAVEWGSAALRAVADTVVPGAGPPAVGDYIYLAAQAGVLPAPPRSRRRLRLGYTDDGREFSLGIKGRNVLIAGETMSGKSWVAGLLCEQLILHGYCVCVIDPEGDYRSLEALPGVVAVGGDDPPPLPRELLKALRYPDRSLVIDLSRCTQDEKIEYIRTVLPMLNEIRRKTGLPHRIFVDEAHYFLDEASAPELLDLEHNGYTFVTCWASRLPAALLQSAEVMLVTRESNPEEVEALRSWCPKCHNVDNEGWASLARLATAQAVALPITEEAGGRLTQFTLGSRLTPHVRHREKYVDVPVSEARAFVFAGPGPRARRIARTLREFILEVGRTRDVSGYLERGDFSRWMGDVFGDHALAAELRDIEKAYHSQPAPGAAAEIIHAVRSRYELDDAVSEPSRPATVQE